MIRTDIFRTAGLSIARRSPLGSEPSVENAFRDPVGRRSLRVPEPVILDFREKS